MAFKAEPRVAATDIFAPIFGIGRVGFFSRLFESPIIELKFYI